MLAAFWVGVLLFKAILADVDVATLCRFMIYAQHAKVSRGIEGTKDASASPGTRGLFTRLRWRSSIVAVIYVYQPQPQRLRSEQRELNSPQSFNETRSASCKLVGVHNAAGGTSIVSLLRRKKPDL